MRLAQFIQTQMEPLLQDWEEAVLEIAPEEMKGKDHFSLRDHASEMLEFISRDLASPQTADESARKALGKKRAVILGIDGDHGTHRLRQGLSMLQMVRELQALRARITLAWKPRSLEAWKPGGLGG